MSRRGDNIRKRADGRWEGRYRMATAGGATRYRSIYGKSYNEVKEKLAGVNNPIKESQPCYSNAGMADREKSNYNIRFNPLMEEWLGEIEKSRKYSTYIKYKTLYRCHIQTLFEDDMLSEMTNLHIHERIAGLAVSDSIRQSILAVIKQTLRYGEEQYGCSITPIVNKSARSRLHSIEIMNRSEQMRLVRFLHEDMDISKAGIFLCLSTGLRLGEVCSLKWTDIDVKRMLLHVNRTVQRIESKEGPAKTILLETPPKSVFSKRDIPLPDNLLPLLMTFRKAGQEYVLCTNKPMEPRTYQNHFKRYLEKICAPNYNFHILRHTFATNCIDSGMDIKSLSEILGHSNVQITLNRYVHPSIETKRKYINALSVDYGQLCGQGAENI